MMSNYGAYDDSVAALLQSSFQARPRDVIHSH
jgi:hypothetical protein